MLFFSPLRSLLWCAFLFGCADSGVLISPIRILAVLLPLPMWLLFLNTSNVERLNNNNVNKQLKKYNRRK